MSDQEDPNDYSDKYNTPLSDEDEAKYQEWAKANKREGDTYDYDMRGAWKEGASQGGNGHFTDKYKKPNHPTFSDQSKYHGVDGEEGGKWEQNGDKWRFTPGSTNKHDPEALKRYFKRAEPGNDLNDTRGQKAFEEGYKSVRGK